MIVGEKCDHKSLDTMESVFKRVQFNMLDFEATHLDDEVRKYNAF